MFEKIIAFFMSIISFFLGLFGISLESNSHEYYDLSYGTHERQVLDLAIPKENDGEIGLVLFIHGGAWIAGDKGSYKNGVKSASETYGFAGASINYRYMSDEIDFNDIRTTLQALIALQDKGEDISKITDKIILKASLQ